MIFELQNASKIQGKTLQIRCFQTTRFGMRILNGFSSFWLLKTRAKSSNLRILSKTPILQKSLFSLGKITIFLVRSLDKSTKIGCSNAMKNNIEEKASKIEFGKPFGLPKSLKIGPQSDVKRSLFRDAMEPTRTSSQINGRHSL